MRMLLPILFAFTTFITFSQSRFNSGDKVPDFNIPGHDKNPVSIASTESKVIILNFWASWCGPCKASVQKILRPMYDDFDRKDLDIIGISNDMKEEKWRGAIESWDLPWQNIWDSDKSLVRNYQVKAIPTYVIIDGNGLVIANGVPSYKLKSEVKKALKSME